MPRQQTPLESMTRRMDGWENYPKAGQSNEKLLHRQGRLEAHTVLVVSNLGAWFNIYRGDRKREELRIIWSIGVSVINTCRSDRICISLMT